MRFQPACVKNSSPCDSKWLEECILHLEKVYPFITRRSIGTSVSGKPLWEIQIGKGAKKIHMNGSFHANEWITSVVLLNLLEHYLFLVAHDLPFMGFSAADLYRQTSLSIVPMVNPDGVDLVLTGPPDQYREAVLAINEGSDEFVHWKANLLGVDLNKQYPANWEIDQKRKAPDGPAPRDYPGKAPLTEPESIAMANLAANSNFDRLLAFHTQGEEFYWGYEGLEPQESAIIAKEFERVSGYKAIQYVDSHAGYKDWFIQEFRRPGFTIELGKGINPLPLSHLEKIIINMEGLFFAALAI